MLLFVSLIPWAVAVGVFSATIWRGWDPLYAMGLTALVTVPTVILTLMLMVGM